MAVTFLVPVFDPARLTLTVGVERDRTFIETIEACPRTGVATVSFVVVRDPETSPRTSVGASDWFAIPTAGSCDWVLLTTGWTGEPNAGDATAWVAASGMVVATTAVVTIAESSNLRISTGSVVLAKKRKTKLITTRD